MYDIGTEIPEYTDYQEIRIIKQTVDSDGIITNIYEDGIVERFNPKLMKKIILSQKESMELFSSAQKEIDFVFKKRGTQKGARKWKK